MVRPGTHPPGALGKVSTTYDDDTFHIQLAPTYLGTSLRNTPEVHVRTLRHVLTSGKRNYVIFPLKMRQPPHQDIFLILKRGRCSFLLGLK